MVARVSGSGFDPVGVTAMEHATGHRRVLMISYHSPPHIEMGAQACAQIARHLPMYGWEPVVLTVRERYLKSLDVPAGGATARNIVRTRVIPHPFTIYRRLKSGLRPRDDGPPAGTGTAERSGTLRRLTLSLLGIPDSYNGWFLPAVIHGLRAIRKHRVEHLFSSAPCWTNHLVGLALARLSGLPWTAPAPNTIRARSTTQIPGKTYEYLRAGRPILALTSERPMADLLRKTGGAWVVHPSDKAGIANAVRKAYQAWKHRLAVPMANRALVTSFDRRLLAGRFAELFDGGMAGYNHESQ